MTKKSNCYRQVIVFGVLCLGLMQVNPASASDTADGRELLDALAPGVKVEDLTRKQFAQQM